MPSLGRSRSAALFAVCLSACSGSPSAAARVRCDSTSASDGAPCAEESPDGWMARRATRSQGQPSLWDPTVAEVDDPDDSGSQAPATLKVALLGDQGIRADARAVLQLIAAEKADALIHLGDFAYADGTPRAWDAQLSAVLGADFPVFGVVGNHDTGNWAGRSGFQAFLKARLRRVPEAQCQGDYGVNSVCTFRGLSFVLSGVGTYGSGHEAFLESALSGSDDAAFRLCIWHKNQHDMQAGSKTDEVGWRAYQICAKHGVPIVTGHEHSYARTFALSAIGDAAQGHGVVGEPGRIELLPGRTVVTIAGLGGQSWRHRTPDHEADTWWASIYAADYQMQNSVVLDTAPSILFGALFIEIGVGGDPSAGRAYFKTTDGVVRDELSLHVTAR